MNDYQILEIEQGSAEWLAFRKKHITATDAGVIIGENPWKKPAQLLKEKLSDENKTFVNDDMKRGTELEPIARDLFILKTGIQVKPAVIVREWAMASLDGMSEEGHILEIKCPNPEKLPPKGEIPSYYFPQLQHQMFVSGASKVYYFSFDGIDGDIIIVDRDDDFISSMVKEEKIFYDKMMSSEPLEDNERYDLEWVSLATIWKELMNKKKEIEIEESVLREKLIALAHNKPAKGWGVSVTPVERKGVIDYGSIDVLKTIDLEKHRKPSTTSWRITNE